MDKRLKYYDLMEQLHGKIMSGEIRPGEKLPSENELSAEYGVSRQTVRKNTRNSKALRQSVSRSFCRRISTGSSSSRARARFCRHVNLYEMLDSYHIPYVFIQGVHAQLLDRPQILLDDCRGAYLATRYLIELGHRRIVGVFKSDDTQGQQRHKGYVQALQEAGIAYDPDKVIWFYTEDRKTHPFERIRQMAKDRGNHPFEAVVAYNDQVAIEVIRALNEEGLSVPQDVSVTGYDNSYLAQTCRVPLTTISHPQEELGAAAAELLLRIIGGGNSNIEGKCVLMEPELVIRESCRRKRRYGHDTGRIKTTCKYESTSHTLGSRMYDNKKPAASAAAFCVLCAHFD